MVRRYLIHTFKKKPLLRRTHMQIGLVPLELGSPGPWGTGVDLGSISN